MVVDWCCVLLCIVVWCCSVVAWCCLVVVCVVQLLSVVSAPLDMCLPVSGRAWVVCRGFVVSVQTACQLPAQHWLIGGFG